MKEPQYSAHTPAFHTITYDSSLNPNNPKLVTLMNTIHELLSPFSVFMCIDPNERVIQLLIKILTIPPVPRVRFKNSETYWSLGCRACWQWPLFLLDRLFTTGSLSPLSRTASKYRSDEFGQQRGEKNNIPGASRTRVTLCGALALDLLRSSFSCREICILFYSCSLEAMLWFR